MSFEKNLDDLGLMGGQRRLWGQKNSSKACSSKTVKTQLMVNNGGGKWMAGA